MPSLFEEILDDQRIPHYQEGHHDYGKNEGRAQTLDLDLRLNLSTRKKLRDHEYEVTVF